MKKILLAFISLLWTSTAFAQSTSIVTDIYSNNNLSLNKVDNIESNTTNSLDVIENTAVDWNNELTRGNNELSNSSNQMQQVIEYMTDKEDEFFEVESDPKGSSYQTYATQVVPSCYGDTSRLVYQGGWKCVEAIDCGTLDASQTDWIQTEDGYCVRKQGIWVTGSWSSNSYNQGCGSRSVTCRDENTNASLNTTHCSSPAPASSRTCVVDPSSWPCPTGASSCTTGTTEDDPETTPTTDNTCGSWSYGDWSACSSGTQTRSVTCSKSCCTGTKEASSKSCLTSYNGAWQNIEGDCVNGSKTNTVTCVGGECDPATKPATETTACESTTEWTVTEWGSCDANGNHHRQVSCPANMTCIGDEPASTEPCCGKLFEFVSKSVSPTEDATTGYYLESANGKQTAHFGVATTNTVTGGRYFKGTYKFNVDKSNLKGAKIVYVWYDDNAWIRINGHTMFAGASKDNADNMGTGFSHFEDYTYCSTSNDGDCRSYTTIPNYWAYSTAGRRLLSEAKEDHKNYYSVDITNQLVDGLNTVEADLVAGGNGEIYFDIEFTPNDDAVICDLNSEDTGTVITPTEPETIEYTASAWRVYRLYHNNDPKCELNVRDLTCPSGSCSGTPSSSEVLSMSEPFTCQSTIVTGSGDNEDYQSYDCTNGSLIQTGNPTTSTHKDCSGGKSDGN